MKTIRVAFRDFWAGFEPEDWFRRHPAWLQDWDFELSERPDLVIHSCFRAALKLDAVPSIDDAALRLFYTAENTPTDLSRTDFAIGFDRDVECERYLRLPNYVAAQNYFGFEPDHLAGRSNRDTRSILAAKQGFCVFVQGHSVPWRDAFVEELSAAKRVDCAGPVLNNTGRTVSRAEKYALLRRYKFAVTFENERSRGYVTEKLNDALLCDAVPIYAGDPSVAEDFEPGSFLDLADFRDARELIDEILRLDGDDEAYLAKLGAPAFRADAPSRWLDPERERAFAARVCSAAAAGRRWFWMRSTPEGERTPAPLDLALGPIAQLDPGEVHLSSDPLDQPHVCADEVALDGLDPAGVRRLRAPGLVFQWEPTEAVAALARWRAALAPDGRLEFALPDWELCRRRAPDDPRRAFAALFAHGSRRAPRWGWSVADVEQALDHAGFEAVDVRPFGHELRVRAGAAVEALTVEDLAADPTPAPDLVVAWPRYAGSELEALLGAWAAVERPGLRLALRHDPSSDGTQAGALACLRRAALSLGHEAELELEIIGQPWSELCPFAIGARTVAAVACVPADPDRRRFAAALGAPVLRPADLADPRPLRRAG